MFRPPLGPALLAAVLGCACPGSTDQRRSSGGRATPAGKDVAVQPQATLSAPTQPAAPVAAPAVQVDWMFRGDAQRTGRSPYRGPRSPERAWSFSAGAPIFASPALGPDGTIYVGALDGVVHALSADGTERWRYATGDAVWSSAAIAEGVVYVGSSDDHLYALDAASGALVFARRLGDCAEPTGRGPEGARCDVDGSPLIAADGTIYVTADGLYAVARSGEPRWRAPLPTHVFSSPALGADGLVIVPGQDDRVRAFDMAGLQKWEYRITDDFDATPAVGADGTIYVGADDGALHALASDGQIRFRLQTRGDVRASPAVGTDGTIYAASFDATLYAVRADGVVAWAFRAGGRIHSSPVVDADGVIWFGAQDDRLYAVAADGKARTTIVMPGDVDSTPAIGPDGTIYVGCDDGGLYAFR